MAAGMDNLTGTTASPWYSFRNYLYELTDPFSPTATITRLYVESRPVKERVIRPNLSPSEETSRLPYTLIWVERKALRRAYIKPDWRVKALRMRQSKSLSKRPLRQFICNQKERGASSPISYK